jgi:hypothetical protein
LFQLLRTKFPKYIFRAHVALAIANGDTPLSWWCCLFPGDLAPLIRGRKNLPSVDICRHEEKLSHPHTPNGIKTVARGPFREARRVKVMVPTGLTAKTALG